MDMLPLVPVVLLGVVGVWLLWPVIVDPLMAQARRARAVKDDTNDGLADTLFGAWREHAERVEPLMTARRG